MNKTTMIKSMAVFAVLVMLMANVTLLAYPDNEAATAEPKGPLTYVSLGDSTVNGYGMADYYPYATYDYYGFEVKPEAIYPSLLAGYLETEGYTVDYRQLALSTMRSMDLRYMLDDGFDGDVATDEFVMEAIYGYYENTGALKNFNVPGYSQNLSGLRDYYQDSVAKADIITYQFSTDFSYTYQKLISGIISGDIPEESFEVFYDAEFIEMLGEAKDFINGHIVKLMTKAGYDPEAIAKTLESIEGVVSATAYAVTMYCTSFDNNMKYIFTNNPNAKVIVVSSTSTMDDFELIADDVIINIGALYGMVIDYCNLYATAISPYSALTYKVDITQDYKTFATEFVNAETGEQVSKDAKNIVAYALLSNIDPTLSAQVLSVMGVNSNENIIPPTGYVMYDLLDGTSYKFTEFLSYVFASKQLNLADLADIADIEEILGPKLKTAFGLIALGECTISYDEETCVLTIADDEKEVEFSASELTLLNIMVGYVSANGALTTPDSIEHLIDSMVIVACLDINKVMEKPAGYPAFMDADSALTMQEALQQYKDLSIKTVTDELHSMFAYLDENWDQMVTVVIQGYFDEADESLNAAYAAVQQFKAELIDALKQAEQTPAVIAAIEFLENEQYTITYYYELKILLNECEKETFSFTDAIEGYIETIDNNWDAIMNGIATGELLDKYYQSALDSMLYILASIDVDAEFAALVAELQGLYDRIASVDDATVKEIVEELVEKINEAYLNVRPQISEDVTEVLDAIKEIIEKILGGDDPAALADEYEYYVDELTNYVLTDYKDTLVLADSQVIALTDYLAAIENYGSETLRAAHLALADIRGDIASYLRATDVDPEEIEAFLLGLIDKAQDAIEDALFACIQGIEDAAKQTRDEATAVDTLGNEYINDLVTELTAAVDQAKAVTDYLNAIAANPDEYLHIKDLKDQIIIIVEKEYPTDEEIAQMKANLTELYEALWSLYDKYYEQIPKALLPYVDKLMYEITETYNNIESFDYAGLKANIIGFLQSSEIEDAFADALRAEAAKLEAKIAAADAYIGTELKAYLQGEVAVVVDALNESADEIEAFAAQLKTVDVKGLMDKLRDIVRSWFEDEESYLAFADNLSLDLSLLADGEESKIEAFLLAIIDKAEAIAEDAQTKAVEALNKIAYDIYEEASEIEASASPFYDSVVAEIVAAVDKLTVASDYLNAIAANPDEYLHIKDLKDKIIAIVEKEYPTDEEIREMKAEIADLYLSLKAFYKANIDQVPDEYKPYVEQFMYEITKIYTYIETYDYEELKANIIGFFQSSEIEDAFADALRAEAAKIEAMVAEIDEYIQNPEYKEYFLSEIQIIVDELYDTADNILIVGTEISDFDVKEFMDKIRAIVKSWFEGDVDVLALADSFQIPDELADIIVTDMPISMKMARLSSYLSQFDLEAFLLSLVDKAEAMAKEAKVQVIGAIQTVSSKIIADAFEIKTDAEIYYDSIVSELIKAVDQIKVVSDYLNMIADNPDEYFDIKECKDKIIAIIEKEYPTDEEIREMKEAIASIYLNIKEVYDKYIDQFPEDERAYLEKLMASITEIYTNIETYDYEGLKANIIGFFQSSQIEDAIAAELRAEAAKVEALVAEIDDHIADPEIKAAVMADVDKILSVLYDAANELELIGAWVYSIDVEGFMDEIREAIKAWFGDEDALALADSFASGLTLTLSDDDLSLKEYFLKLVDEAEAACKAAQAQAAAAVENIAKNIDDLADQIEAEAAQYADYIIGYCTESIAKIGDIVEDIRVIAMDPGAYFDLQSIKQKLTALVEEDFPTDDQFDAMKALFSNFAENLELYYEAYKDQIPEEYWPMIEQTIAQIQEYAAEFEEVVPEELEQEIIDTINGPEFDDMISEALRDAAAELEKLERAAIAYINDPELKAQILAEIAKITGEIENLAAEIAACGQQIAGYDLSPYFDEIRDEINSWFETDRAELREAIEAIIPEINGLIDDLTGVVPDEILQDLIDVRNMLFYLDRNLDNMTDEQIDEKIAEIDESLMAFFTGYLQYEIQVIEDELKELIDEIMQCIESTDFYKYVMEIIEQIKPYIDTIEQYIQQVYQTIIEQIEAIEAEIKEVLESILDIETEDIMKIIDAQVLDFENAIRAEEDNVSAAVLYITGYALQKIQEVMDLIENEAPKDEIKAAIAEMEAELIKAKQFDIKPYCQNITEFVNTVHEIRMDITENGPNKYFVEMINNNYDVEQKYQAEFIQYLKQEFESEEFQDFVKELDEFLTEIEEYEFMFTGELNTFVKKFLVSYDEVYDEFESTVRPVLEALYAASDDVDELREVISVELAKLLAGLLDPETILQIESVVLYIYDVNPEPFMQFAAGAQSIIDSVEQQYAEAGPSIEWLANHTTYNVTWIDENGDSYTDENIIFAILPEYKGVIPAPVYTETTIIYYDWVDEYDDDMNLTRTLTCFEEERLYTITWVTEDAVYTSEFTYGSTPEYDYDAWGIPTKEEGSIPYEFLGWNTTPRARTALPVLPEVTEDATYYAIFKESDLRLLAIHYVYSDMTEALPDYTAYLEIGTQYTVYSPTIDGYVVVKPIVSGVMDEDGQDVIVKYLKKA